MADCTPSIHVFLGRPLFLLSSGIYLRNSRTFLTKILYLNLGCMIYARKRFYINKCGYAGNFLNIVLNA